MVLVIGYAPALTKIFPPDAGSALIASCNDVKSPLEGSGLTTKVDSYRSTEARLKADACDAMDVLLTVGTFP